MYQTSDIKKGLKIEENGAPYTVVDFLFVKPGKGCAFTRTKLKNLITGSVLDRTYKTGESLVEADVQEHTMQYLYNDGTDFHFMNMEDFSQIGISAEVIGNTSDFLIEEMEVQVLFYNNAPVNIDLPNFVELEIEYTEPGIKGNTAQGATKSATLVTGAEVQVPLFIEQGEILKIDTRTRQYVSRVR